MGAVVPFPMCRTPAQPCGVRSRSASAKPPAGEVIILPVVQFVRDVPAPSPPPVLERREPL